MISTGDSRQKEVRLMRYRIVVGGAFAMLLAVILIARLAYLQIGHHQRFSIQAQHNRIDFTPLPAVRGLIYDRNGVVLAENIPIYTLQILPDQVDDMDALLDELGELVALSDYDLQHFRALLSRRTSFEWQTLRTNLNEEEAARVGLNQHRYRGVELRTYLQRNYPYGQLTAHTVGYISRLSVDDLESVNRYAYRGFEYTGRSGIESYYESALRGNLGVEQVETDSHGRVVRSAMQTTVQAGQNIHLSLDIELQRKSMQALQGFEGAIVALVPKSGEVLAFASAPTFNPNLFVNGISETDYSQLRTMDERPLLNRALYGRYAPGSTIKGFMMLAGLENGVDRDEEVFCPGWYSLPNFKHRYRDWKRDGHGYMDAHDSIVQSCDVYFYQLAERLGIERIHKHMSLFGFGKKTGVDLPLEPSGLLPSPQWKRKVRGQVWFPGETVITGIGQGYLLVTPLQLATATAILANRGRRVTPRFITELENPQTGTRQTIQPQVINSEQLSDSDSYEYILDSMHDVVHSDKGTARGIRYGMRYEMAGKTGTAQVINMAQDEDEEEEEVEREKKFRDHSLFIAFAPYDDPQIAIAVVVEHAGDGSRVAAPIARKLIDYYLIKRLEMFAQTTSNQKVVATE